MIERDQLRRLASLVKQRNAVDQEITGVLGRPALTGHLGEFIAARVFQIALLESASHKGIDGHFTNGPLAGRSVDVKFYTKNEGILDITLNAPPDFYLVMTGPRTQAESSRGTTRPWVISSVFLFDASDLVHRLNRRGVKIGIATSVARHFWDDAEIYPRPSNPVLRPTPEQRSLLEMFGER